MRTVFHIVAWVAGVAAVILGLLYLVAFDVWTVPGDDALLVASMQPTLGAGDIVVLTRHPSVARGNLLRCPDPQAPGRFVVARAMAQYGDKIAIADEVVSIDGRHTPSPRACDDATVSVFNPNTNGEVELQCVVEEYGEMTYAALRSLERVEPPTKATVEKGNWFLVSDNRHIHLDSRDYGQLDVSTCQHVLFRLVGPAGWRDYKRRLTVIW